MSHNEVLTTTTLTVAVGTPSQEVLSYARRSLGPSTSVPLLDFAEDGYGEHKTLAMTINADHASTLIEELGLIRDEFVARNDFELIDAIDSLVAQLAEVG